MKKLHNNQVTQLIEETWFEPDHPLSHDIAMLGLDFPERFYEDRCPPFPHEPTRDRFAVITTEEKGEGLISLVNIEAGEMVFRFHGKRQPYQTLFTLQQAPGRYVEDPVVMGKVLHSCDPNMRCDMRTLTFRAVKPILAGEFLTMDYDSTEDELYRPFQCGCGASNCRGHISGRLKRA